MGGVSRRDEGKWSRDYLVDERGHMNSRARVWTSLSV